MTGLIWLGIFIAALILVARVKISIFVWSVGITILLAVLQLAEQMPLSIAQIIWPVFAVLVVVINIPALRSFLISAPTLKLLRRAMPSISDTEREAIEAGSVWWEGELFKGGPDWSKLLNLPAPLLTKEEQAFLDGPVEKLCAMLDDWEITHALNDLPPNVWKFIKDNRFFGINIPTKYGGLDFSPLANSEIVMKVCGRSGTAGVTVMVPNSLGPAELLLHYGTKAQKDYYLPRLASGQEVPCFALTGPDAGSDAGAMPDVGVVCKGKYKGKQVLGLKINWEKRYITLGPVATVLGLAFKAMDPDHLLGDKEELGITCALIPTTTPGVSIGHRHYPLNSSFQNGPNQGKDVFIPLDWIIGGLNGIGQGWRMLVESLAAGRGISLPASGVSTSKLAVRMTGAYSRIREQFNIPIGRFEGVEEVLARMGGLTYMMESARLVTAAALNQGEKPSVVTGIIKYHLTESARQVVNDAMDIHGGRGICMGPSNYLARFYQQIPIGITVEGANILTRTLIIFGQGVMRCHPYLQDEVLAANAEDRKRALPKFDRVLFDHIGYVFTNGVRSLLYGLTGGRLAPVPPAGVITKYYRHITRMSAAFSLLADFGLLTLGGALKRKEKISGRFADALSYMYLGSTVLKYYEDSDRPYDDLPLVEWACQHCVYQTQLALDGILRNFPVAALGFCLRWVVFPFGRRYRIPGDKLGHKVAQLLMSPTATRDRLTKGLYNNSDPKDITGRMEHALQFTLKAEPIKKILKDAKVRKPDGVHYADWLGELVRLKTINSKQAKVLSEAYLATRNAIMVDDFEPVASVGSTPRNAGTASKKKPVKKTKTKKKVTAKADKKPRARKVA